MENLVTEFLQLLPTLNECIFLTKCGEKLIELRFENIGIRQRLASIVQRGENPKGSILGLGFDGQEDTVVHYTGRQVCKVCGILGKKIVDAFLKKPEIAGIDTLSFLIHLTGSKYV
jgi:hypothetical protein